MKKRLRLDHMLRPNDLLNMQEDFIFFDTETSFTKKENETIHTLKIGYGLYWNRKNDVKEWLYFDKAPDFWDFVEDKIEDKKELIIYAHNVDFDFKIVDGLKNLFKRKWNLKKFYINGTVFSLMFNKGQKKLYVYDTCNYMPCKLEQLGKSLKHPKMEINFNTCTHEELKVYCKNDVEIIYLFIKSLISFLNKYELTRLRPTASSLAMNTFRHKFYNYNKYPIFIHVNKACIALERESYHGAITDCFRIGRFKTKLNKYDINSMYPYQMLKYDFPTKLLYYSSNPDEKLYDMMEEYINDYHIILKADIELPEEYAYILTKLNDNKCGFLSGKFKVTVCTPEIEFILKHGRILKVYELAIYEKAPIFKEYVEFFYKKRWEFKDDNNFIFEQFCKLLSNGLYGKFGQHDSKYDVLNDNMEFDLGRYEVKEEKNKKVSEYILMHVGNRLVKVENTEDNAYDSFVAIASMVTSYARMYLVELILTVGRENLYYVDTDSLIINAEASHKLDKFIDNRKLGYLKFEGSSFDSEFIRPKWYKFGNEIKCKGVKKDAEIITDTGDTLIIVQEQWERFKTSISKKNVDKQKIAPIFKVLDKKYDKGTVDKNGYVYPFKVGC